MKLAWKQVLVAFLLGALVGGVGVLQCPWLLKHRWDRVKSHERMLHQFGVKLKLTPEQRAKVETIFEEKRDKIDALRAEMKPRFESMRASASAEVRALLTPEQQKTFDVLQAQWEARKKRWSGRWGER